MGSDELLEVPKIIQGGPGEYHRLEKGLLVLYLALGPRISFLQKEEPSPESIAEGAACRGLQIQLWQALLKTSPLSGRSPELIALEILRAESGQWAHPCEEIPRPRPSISKLLEVRRHLAIEEEGTALEGSLAATLERLEALSAIESRAALRRVLRALKAEL